MCFRRSGDDLFVGSNVTDFGGKIRRSPGYRGHNQRDGFQTVFAPHENDSFQQKKADCLQTLHLWLIFDYNEAIFAILGARSGSFASPDRLKPHKVYRRSNRNGASCL